ncbi:hypothetical protein Skr01_25740 [Sphaerisporangium krabiense]|uniref:DUF4012 domain-containing protein n=1 Tax=Sphaerisporangium krabiense TaxID=763782 RepID=A0A7W8ZAT0_9ACTN|nr:DUF4012 domain-containing protein [Sphaerisporangium krabiense]MBB5630557.1 hypothetical protein [Sphaerisporangium krabiense]GII62489.1 hypothetical protein Skr01_25740 [Sphaerisporangium krabiense]
MRARRRRRVAAAALLPVLVLTSYGGWSAYAGLSVRDHLQATRDALVHLRAVMSARDLARIRVTLADAQRHAAEARRLTSRADWALLTHLPLVGDGATTVRGIAASAAEVTGVLTGVQGVGASLLTAGSGADDADRLLNGLRTAAPVLHGAAARLTRARDHLAATPARTRVASLDEARGRLLSELDRLRGWIGSAATAAELLPPMLGGDGPRRYFLAFQTNAESRGTGGLVGAFGILSADHGRVRVTRLAANNDLTPGARPVVDHGPAFRERYGEGAATLLSVSNLSPHFPYAAGTWTALWERKTGRRLDGALAIDPVGLSYVLAVIGPVTLPGGERVTASNVVDLTERAAYARYPDPVRRKRFLIAIAAAVGEALPKAFPAPSHLLPVLKPMAEERRLQIWSRHAAEQRRLSGTALGGVLPRRPGPYAGLVVNNSAGGKLDYYLNRSVEYTLGPCRGGRRSSRVRVRLTNDVPGVALPSYVTGRLDSPDRPHAPGSNLLWVSLYAGVGSELTGTRVDGRTVWARTETERSHPVHSILLELAPGQSRTWELDLVEPASGAAPVVPAQPLARPQQSRVDQDRHGCPP